MTRFLGNLLRRPQEGEAPGSRAPRSAAAKIGFLSETDVFRDLNDEEMAELDRMTAMTTCRRGRVFYAPGETGEVLFVLKRGRVNIYRITAEGRKLVTETLGPGTIFGEMSLIGQGMRESFAEAATDCTLCVMSRADLEHVLVSYPQVALRLVEALAARLEAAEERLETLAFKGVPARLAEALLRLAGLDGVEIDGVTHQDLAELIGAYRETTTKILNEFRARGLIDLHRLRIRILDREALRHLAES
jgi:CRP/FNR family transcriptional regulator, cyclic AMP receptor protein